jgi:putative transposase
MSHAKQLHHPSYFDDYMEIINRRGLPGNVKTEVRPHVHHAVLTTVQSVIEQALEEELNAYLGGVRYEHLPCGRGPERTRSGSYRRELFTQYGGIPDLRVPKLRRGNGDVSWQTIERYERCWGPFLDQRVMGYCLGLSLRELHESIRLTLGEGLSVSSCNRLVLGLAQQMEAFKMTPLAAPPPILLVDGMWVKIAYPSGERREDAQGRRRAVKRQQKRVVLSALGVWPDGHWEIVHWQVTSGENQPAWEAFFKELAAKGMTAQTTELVASDGAKGLENALVEQLKGVPHQRCICHKIKNIADHLGFDDLEVEGSLDDTQAVRNAKPARKQAMLADAGRLSAGDVEADIRAQAAAFRATWEGREPKAVANFFTDFDKTLSYLQVDFPTSLAPLIRTTNLLERFHREVRRKQYDIGMFQSERGCEVLWYLISMRESAKRQAALKSRS